MDASAKHSLSGLGKGVTEELKTSDLSALVAKLQLLGDDLNGSRGRAWARWP